MKKNVYKLFAFSLFLFIGTSLNAQWLSTANNKIVKDGAPITLRGVNFGNWLVWEGYMMNMDVTGRRRHTDVRNNIKNILGGDEAKAAAFQNNWRNNYITEGDFQQAKARGYNAIRIPFHYNDFWTGSALKNDGFVWLDKAVQWATSQQIYVIFDMHAAPGCQNPDYHSDNTSYDDHNGPVNFWANWNNVNIAGDIWRHIANRYKDNAYVGSGNVAWIAGYELLNEPKLDIQSEKWKLLESYKQMTAKIRQIDGNHLVFVEGNYYGSDFYDMLVKFDSKLVWAAHYYGKDQDEADPNPGIYTIKSQATSVGVPLLYNEFGENTENWVKKARLDYETQNVGWMFWSWKRQSTDRAIYSFNSTYGWDQITNYVNYGGNAPSVANVESWLNEMYAKIRIGSCTLSSSLQNKLRPGWPTGSVIWLQNGGKFVSSNNGIGPVTCDRPSAAGWEKFTVVDAGDWKIALLGCNGKYVNSQNGYSAITCNSTYLQGWEAFEWVDVDGQVALKGCNGKFICSENGAMSGMTCNRETVSGWEAFNYGISTLSAEIVTTLNVPDIKSNILVYPNPVLNGTFNLKISNVDEQNPGYLKVTDLNGRIVFSQQITSENTQIASLNYLVKGTYQVNIENKEKSYSTKLIVK